MYSYIDEGKMPIKVYVTGSINSGKTTFVKSFLHYFGLNHVKRFWRSLKLNASREGKKRLSGIDPYLEGNQMCVDVYLQNISEQLCLNVFDLGGHECFYATHSIFLRYEDSIFFIVFSLMDSKDELARDIENQLGRIASHFPLDIKPNVIFIGTSFDAVTDFPNTQVNIQAIMSKMKKKFNLSLDCIYINAKKPATEDLSNLKEKTLQMSRVLKENMVSSLLRDLRHYSEF